jgi:DDE superfamily endonuclease
LLEHSNECHILTFQHKTCQPPGRVSSGIDVDSIWANIRFFDRRVAVHNDLAEPVLVQEKVFPGPQQVVLVLLRQRDTGSNTGVREEVIAAGDGLLQTRQEATVALGQVGVKCLSQLAPLALIRIDDRRHAVGQKRLEPSELSPVIERGGIAQKPRNIGFVVALEADHAMALATRNQKIEHFTRLRSAVDVIAEQNLNDPGGRVGGHVGVDPGKERPEQVGAAGKATNKRILALLDQPPPQGYGRWTGPLLAKALGDVDVQYVWRFLREHKIDLIARKSWCESKDPEFVAKAADVVGLYIDPPAKAIVLCVDEKPSIQALERAQGYLKLPNGRALTGQSHDYRRHGTTTLFAALEVATGRIIAAHSKRRRRVEFLGFMNSLVAGFPDRELHVILDNLNTHKKNERWLKKHPKVHFHFIPTRSSWLNQVETWFSILQGQSLNGASFTAVEQLQEHIDAFIAAYNETAEPFAWANKKVYQRRFKNRRITQL